MTLEQEKLSGPMREALAGPVRHPGYGLTLLCYGTRQTLEALERRGLVNGAALTEAGLLVRKELARVTPADNRAREGE